MVMNKLSYRLVDKISASSYYRAALSLKVKVNGIFPRGPRDGSSNPISHYPSLTNCNLHGKGSQTLVCDIQSTLMRSQSFFPYFMLVAFEGGSIFRAFFLLLSCPLLCVLGFELKLRVMIFITFCGLRCKDMDVVSKAVLPKFYLENLNYHVYKALASAGSRLVFTSVPRVMVEGFLKEYLNVDTVKGTELHTIGEYYTGLLSSSGLLLKLRALEEFCGAKKPDIGIVSFALHDHEFVSLCKEAYVVKVEDRIANVRTIMPREKYPKPLIFHDGRLAFLPTPLATLTMFLWLPLGIVIASFRIIVGVFFPMKIAIFLIALTGATLQVKMVKSSSSSEGKGLLYICNHRTLLDPLVLSAALGKTLTTVFYSISRFSEIIVPMRIARLTRDRKQDAEIIKKLLSQGDLVVCPEGTTCREPYLLRFSSLFAVLADDIVPVAVNTHVTMFYGTTASGFKCLDLFFFFLNPRVCYSIQVLDKVPREHTVAGGESSHDVANYIQRQLADALGFECTTLTRRDKYMILAGNEGVVHDKRKKSSDGRALLWKILPGNKGMIKST